MKWSNRERDAVFLIFVCGHRANCRFHSALPCGGKFFQTHTERVSVSLCSIIVATDSSVLCSSLLLQQLRGVTGVPDRSDAGEDALQLLHLAVYTSAILPFSLLIQREIQDYSPVRVKLKETSRTAFVPSQSGSQ